MVLILFYSMRSKAIKKYDAGDGCVKATQVTRRTGTWRLEGFNVAVVAKIRTSYLRNPNPNSPKPIWDRLNSLRHTPAIYLAFRDERIS